MGHGPATIEARRARPPARRPSHRTGATAGGRAWRLAAWALLGLGALIVANAAYQVARKPTEVLGLVFAPTPQTPRETWRRYGHLFRAHATAAVRPELLAALAQAESQGDAVAGPPWRWRWSWNPFALYAPASSAVGLYQLTDAAFADARQLCVHDHRLARAGSWHDVRSCWFTGLYSRVVPSHAIELTAARLDDLLTRTVGAMDDRRAPRAQRERLAAVIHLCGPARGAVFVRRGFRLGPGERCGAHGLAPYVARVEALVRTFERLARA